MKTKTRYGLLTGVCLLIVATLLLADRKQWMSMYFYHGAFTMALILFLIHYETAKPMLLFAHNCFLKPFLIKIPWFGKSSKLKGTFKSSAHQELLEQFYEGQADIYDLTRRRLLRGRRTMLRLCAAQLAQRHVTPELSSFNANSIKEAQHPDAYNLIPSPPPSPFLGPSLPISSLKKNIWIDLGGGTGWNIEQMNSFVPIGRFHAIFLVDITPSLCDIAELRFAALGWSNVKVLCMDAMSFQLPDELKNDPTVDVCLVTMSYALSMMETIYPLVDKIQSLLSRNGILGVADFYASGKFSSQDPTRSHSYFFRWFWQLWFELDNVYLHSSRREYLEHKFLTVKRMNGLNRFIGPFVKIPYYIWIGAQRLGDEIASDCGLDLKLPYPLEPNIQFGTMKKNETLTELEISRKHVHGQSMIWRQPYNATLLQSFHTYIYAFAWEDPSVDLKHLNLNPNDNMLILTSGGCNALEYAIHGPKTIHCVDMNPHQGHLLELKLAALTSLNYSDFWRLFGEGHHAAFTRMLDTYLSPYMSSHAYQYWKNNCDFENIYLTGCSGTAISVFQILSRIVGLDSAIEKMCSTDSLDEQIRIWTEKVRPHFLNRNWISLLGNYKFAWDALGVPRRQFEMLLKEGNVFDYVSSTFDPLIRKYLISKENYFYHICLRQRYAGQNPGECPSYLTPDGFEKLKTSANLEAVRIHTAPILNVLEHEIKPGTLTKAILMDHMDWFNGEQAHDEISALTKSLKPGGVVFWRSAAKIPWYAALFRKYGFKVQPIAVRMTDVERSQFQWKRALQEWTGQEEVILADVIDRVNMYASFWKATKP